MKYNEKKQWEKKSSRWSQTEFVGADTNWDTLKSGTKKWKSYKPVNVDVGQ